MTRRVTLLGLFLAVLVACDDDPVIEPGIEIDLLPPPTTPENLIRSIEILYNDKVRSHTERLDEYENLLAPPAAGCDTCPSFIFDFQPWDEQQHGTPDVWGRDAELQAHRNLFQAQDDGNIYSLTVGIQQLSVEDLNDVNRPGWKKVIATNAHLRLLINPNDGIEVNGRAEFLAYPDQGRWWLGEWIDLPSLAADGASVAVDPSTWGRIKASYGPRLPPLRRLNAPENLVHNLQVLYNDRLLSPAERLAEYQKLLAPPSGCGTCESFVFDFQPADEVEHGAPDTWGRDAEIQAHEHIFHAQANQDIYSLSLSMHTLPPKDLNDPGREGWKGIFAANVHLRLLINPNEGFEVSQGQAEFRAYPTQGRWSLGEWIDLPSLVAGGPPVAVEPFTWGRFKLAYR